ncbi:MAG: hypothetical protein IJ609_03175, partial [Paludibacteraceae bacterium]|nr:hypothetical protein [Paludibacteraceae bacterium]
GVYYPGTEVTVRATPLTACDEFVRWSDGSTEAVRTFTLEHDTTLRAEFRRRLFNLRVSTDGHGSATVRR